MEVSLLGGFSSPVHAVRGGDYVTLQSFLHLAVAPPILPPSRKIAAASGVLVLIAKQEGEGDSVVQFHSSTLLCWCTRRRQHLEYRLRRRLH